jgi:hypothetical protein
MRQSMQRWSALVISLMLAVGHQAVAAPQVVAADLERLVYTTPATFVFAWGGRFDPADPFERLMGSGASVTLEDEAPAPRKSRVTFGDGSFGSAAAAANLNSFMARSLVHFEPGGGNFVDVPFALASAYREVFVPSAASSHVKVNVTFHAVAQAKASYDATRGSGGDGRVQGQCRWWFNFGSRVPDQPSLWLDLENPIDPIDSVNYPGFFNHRLQAWGFHWADHEGLPGTFYRVLVEGNTTTYEEQGEGPGSQRETRTVEIVVGTRYLMQVEAFCQGGGGLIVIDPVVEPHADNPDIVIEFPDTVDDPEAGSPLADMSPEELEALGIAPQPFIDAGFFGSGDTPPPADSSAPTTAAVLTPDANAGGWNSGAVTVSLTAIDELGGSGVKQIHVVLGGASAGSHVIPGATASIPISAEGATVVTFFSVDAAGNQESPQVRIVRIDRTPPVLAGLPAATCTLWPPDHRLVPVASITASDSLSGLVGAPAIEVTSSEPDLATGEGDLAPDAIVTGGTVQLRAERAGSGPGRVYTVAATVSDVAGNTATASATCTVPHDRRVANP